MKTPLVLLLTISLNAKQCEVRVLGKEFLNITQKNIIEISETIVSKYGIMLTKTSRKKNILYYSKFSSCEITDKSFNYLKGWLLK